MLNIGKYSCISSFLSILQRSLKTDWRMNVVWILIRQLISVWINNFDIYLNQRYKYFLIQNLMWNECRKNTNKTINIHLNPLLICIQTDYFSIQIRIPSIDFLRSAFLHLRSIFFTNFCCVFSLMDQNILE